MAHLVEIYSDPLFLWFPIMTVAVSVGGFLLFALHMAWLLALAIVAWPLLRLTRVHFGGWPGWRELAWQLPLFLVIDDVGNYLLHRTMHGRWLYKRVHALHHRMATPTALAGAYFHPVEYLLLNIVAIIGPLAVGANVVT